MAAVADGGSIPVQLIGVTCSREGAGEPLPLFQRQLQTSTPTTSASIRKFDPDGPTMEFSSNLRILKQERIQNAARRNCSKYIMCLRRSCMLASLRRGMEILPSAPAGTRIVLKLVVS